MSIYERITELAERKKISKAYLCRKIGKSDAYLRQVKAGRFEIPLSTLDAIAETLGTTVEYLKGETDNPAAAKQETDAEALLCESIKAINTVLTLLDESKREAVLHYAIDLIGK